jgi:D-alanyl-D-alanine dipeptidase
MELFLYDAYRPISVQNYFFRSWIPDYLCRENPEKGQAWARAETARYWTEASDEPSLLQVAPPPHSTGGAVDLTIRRIDGCPREMGSMFDDITERSWPNYFEQRDAVGFTEREAMFNRRLLFHLMTAEGFAHHPFEWWHFSYGDRAWGSVNTCQAFYGYLPSPR